MLSIIKGRTYRHMSCIDVDMHVLGIEFLEPDYFELKVVWVNRLNGILYEDSSTIRLQRKDLNKWSVV